MPCTTCTVESCGHKTIFLLACLILFFASRQRVLVTKLAGAGLYKLGHLGNFWATLREEILPSLSKVECSIRGLSPYYCASTEP